MKTIITIGRQFGSGGKEAGIRVAKELGIPFYDKEILQEAAKKSGLCQKILENFDERPKSLLYSIAMDSYMFALPGTDAGIPWSSRFILPPSTPSATSRPRAPASSSAAARTTPWPGTRTTSASSSMPLWRTGSAGWPSGRTSPPKRPRPLSARPTSAGPLTMNTTPHSAGARWTAMTSASTAAFWGLAARWSSSGPWWNTGSTPSPAPRRRTPQGRKRPHFMEEASTPPGGFSCRRASFRPGKRVKPCPPAGLEKYFPNFPS